MPATKQLKLMVNGIHCNGCASKIKNSIKFLDEASLVEVDVSSGEVKVTYDGDKNSLSEIKKSIMSVGFTVESVEVE
jgi:copper chaperone CopZ